MSVHATRSQPAVADLPPRSSWPFVGVSRSGMSDMPPTPFVIMRSTGHSGSGWLSQLFQTQRLAFFFEFTGRCDKGLNVTVDFERTFAEGCSCARSAVPTARLAAACKRPAHILEKESYNCEKLALCHSSCPGPEPSPFACQAIGMVQSASGPWLERIAAYQLSQAAVGAHEARSLRLITFERDNAAKQGQIGLAHSSPAAAEGRHLGPRGAALRSPVAKKRLRWRSGASPKSPIPLRPTLLLQPSHRQ